MLPNCGVAVDSTNPGDSGLMPSQWHHPREIEKKDHSWLLDKTHLDLTLFLHLAIFFS